MKAAIIGGGVIGGGWAARFLLNGWDVALHDPDPEAGRKVEAVLGLARRSLPGLYDRPLPPEGTLTRTGLAEAVAGADWVQESVPERLDAKHATYARIRAAAPDALLASSTSGLKPSDLGHGAIVAHPFNPVYLLPLVELVGDAATTARAAEILRGIGMHPLVLRREIDAHLADRFLEAVWREALWLVRDGIATTEEVDEAIRMGFGLRWAQMGLFETYRIAGGEAGMRHFLAQFGPALHWPWTRLTDVPDLDHALVERIAAQSDAQSGHLSIRALERQRDDNLVGLLRSLKRTGSGAGGVVAAHEAALTAPAPPVTLERAIPTTWTDHNGHMNETYYLEAASLASDRAMAAVGADAAYVAGGLSYFTVETHIRHLDEARAGEVLRVETRVLGGEGKRLHLWHALRVGEREVATVETMLIHVDLATRRSCPPREDVARMVADWAARDAAERPEGAVL